MFVPMVLMCDSADIDPVTQVCAHSLWAHIPSFLPEFDAASGVAVGTAIWLVWAVAYGLKKLRRAGD
jgi:hypothetical protein